MATDRIDMSAREAISPPAARPPYPFVGSAEWTQKGIDGTMRLADAGSFTRLHDFARFAHSDPHLRGSLDYRAKLARKKPIWTAGVGDTDGSVLEIVKKLYSRPKNPLAPRHIIAKAHREGILTGLSLIHKPWKTEIIDGSNFYTFETQNYPLRFLGWDWRESRWKVDTANGVEYIDPSSNRWSLFLPYGEYMPWDQAIWWALARRLTASYYALGDMGKNAEMVSKVWGVLTTDTGQGGRSKELLSKDIAEGNGVMVLGKGEDFKPFQPGTAAHEIYEAILRFSGSSTSGLVRGGDLLETAGVRGSNAAAQTQQQTGASYVEDDNYHLQAFELTALIQPFVFANWGNRPDLVPTVEYSNDIDTNPGQLASAASTAADGLNKLVSASKAAGIELDKEELNNAFKATLKLYQRMS